MRINIKKLESLIICVIAFLIISGIRVEAYTDSDLYNEKLAFDAKGNLIMTTHDKKATSKVTYKTIGWVIKRHNMPITAEGQQYAIIPMSSDVINREDPSNPAYIYCSHMGDKDTIATAIGSVSMTWKNQLYKYGDEVYIDEIMTVVENGSTRGGLLGINGESWGEVYYTYEGIAEARAWASKENLRTHYNKSVYFPSQVYPKYFKKTETTVSHLSTFNEYECNMNINEGTKYYNTYDIEKAVPTGASLYIAGDAEKYYYKIDFDKKSIDFDIPIRFIIRYTLKWKAYDGTLKTENKEITQWYYVHRRITYYSLNEYKVNYLESAYVYNYAFDRNEVTVPISGTIPKIVFVRMNDYDYHVDFPEYNDTYYIDGGTLSQMQVNGIKPLIPDINRQKTADEKIGIIKVRNDYFKMNDICVLSNSWMNNNTSTPFLGKLSAKETIYSAGYVIPNTKQNRQNQSSSGYYVYKEFGSSNSKRVEVKNIRSVSIHTPVYINGKVYPINISEDNANIMDNVLYSNNEFDIDAVTCGQHISFKGYGKKDYVMTTDKIEVKFNCSILVKGKGETDAQIVKADTWFKWNKADTYILDKDVAPGEYTMDIRAFAKNYLSINDIYSHSEDMANCNYDNYMAVGSIKFAVEKIKDEESGHHIVVGTH